MTRASADTWSAKLTAIEAQRIALARVFSSFVGEGLALLRRESDLQHKLALHLVTRRH